MEWTVAVFGELAFPPDGIDAWRRSTVDASRYHDWIEEFEAEGLAPAKVRDVIEALRFFSGGHEAPGRFEIATAGDRIEVLGFLQDEGYRTWCAHVASLFRVAADAGAAGDAYFVNVTGLYAYRVHVGAGESSFTEVPDGEIDGLCSTLKPSEDGAPRGRFQPQLDRVLTMLGAPAPSSPDEASVAARDEAAVLERGATATWTYAVFGELAFPPGGVDAWRALVADPSRFDDWVDGLRAPSAPAKVGALLDEMVALRRGAGGPGRFEVTVADRRARVVGALDEEEERAPWCARVATAFRVAAGAGGSGELVVVSTAGLRGYRVRVGRRGASFAPVRERGALDALRQEDGFGAALRMVMAGTPVTQCGPRAPTGVDDAAYGRLVALLERVPVRKLEAALKVRGGVLDPETRRDLLRASQALPLLRLGPTEGIREFAAYLAWELDREGLEPIAVQLIEGGADLALTAIAVQVLRQSKRPEARAALLAVLADPRRDTTHMPAFDALRTLASQLGDALAGVLAERVTPDFVAHADAAVLAGVVDVLRRGGVTLAGALGAALERRREPIVRRAVEVPVQPMAAPPPVRGARPGRASTASGRASKAASTRAAKAAKTRTPAAKSARATSSKSARKPAAKK